MIVVTKCYLLFFQVLTIFFSFLELEKDFILARKKATNCSRLRVTSPLILFVLSSSFFLFFLMGI